MYKIPVEIRESVIEGRGVFALRKILKNEIVWKFEQDYDRTLSKAEYNSLNILEQDELNRVSYLSPTSNRFVYPPENDPARFTNHSMSNNLSVMIDTEISDEPYFIANRDIEKDEEITNNYYEFDQSIKSCKPDWMK